jgi:hypothetical protein
MCKNCKRKVRVPLEFCLCHNFSLLQVRSLSPSRCFRSRHNVVPSEHSFELEVVMDQGHVTETASHHTNRSIGSKIWRPSTAAGYIAPAKNLNMSRLRVWAVTGTTTQVRFLINTLSDNTTSSCHNTVTHQTPFLLKSQSNFLPWKREFQSQAKARGL